MAAYPRLTELTISANPYDARVTKTGILHNPVRRALLAISELVAACEALPDFDVPDPTRSHPSTSPDMLVWAE